MIRRHAPPRRALAFDHVDEALAQALRISAQSLDVREMHRQIGLAPDAQRLFRRREQSFAFLAQMGLVQPALQARLARERDDFLRLREALRRIIQPRRKPERALAHALGDEAAHRLQFGRRRRARNLADDRFAHGAEARERPDIDADAKPLEPLGLLGDLERAVAVVADEDRRNALADMVQHFALVAVVGDEIAERVRVRINESRRHQKPRRVDRSRRAHLGPVPHKDDPVTFDPNINGAARRSGPVVDDAAADQDIELRLLRPAFAWDRGQSQTRRQREKGKPHPKLHEPSSAGRREVERHAALIGGMDRGLVLFLLVRGAASNCIGSNTADSAWS